MNDGFIRSLDLEHDEQDALDVLVKQWRDKRDRNRLRAAYYDGKNAVHDLGISTPPAMRRLTLINLPPGLCVSTRRWPYGSV